MSNRKVPPVVTDSDAVAADATSEFEVEAHGVASNYAEPKPPEGGTAESPDAGAGIPPSIVMGWTPEEATHLICALFNFGMLVWGPEWAADPRETAGWNISAAQLLDQVLPKGTGGYVELGAGLLMVGNGLAMMTVHRLPLIQRGPRPMWGTSRPAPRPEGAEAPQPPPPSNGTGAYKMPRDLVPTPNPEPEL